MRNQWLLILVVAVIIAVITGMAFIVYAVPPSSVSPSSVSPGSISPGRVSPEPDLPVMGPAGYNCNYGGDPSKPCGGECGTKAGCMNADPGCCFTRNHSDPDGVPAWCYYPENGRKCYDRRQALENYYSFAKTISLGGVIPPNPGNTLVDYILHTDGDFENNKLTTDDGVSLPYTVISGDGVKTTLLDWDSSSGGMCGNSWGAPSDLARIYFNMLSYSAPTPLINGDVHKAYLDKIIYNPVSYTMINQGPDCIGTAKNKDGLCGPASVFMDGDVYNAGFMLMGNGWGHYGDTYGYTTIAEFFPEWYGKNAGYWLPGSWLHGLGFAMVGSQNTEIENAAETAIYDFLADTANITDAATARDYLYTAIVRSLTHYLADPSYGYAEDNVVTVGIYAYDPDTQESYTTWASACVMKDSSGKLVAGACGTRYPAPKPLGDTYLGVEVEPKYYFGSATKPITSQMVVNAVYERVWQAGLVTDFSTYNNDFIRWYAGAVSTNTQNAGLYGIGAVTMGKLAKYTNNFAKSQYQEKLSVSGSVQDLLYKILYSAKACDPKYCSRLINVLDNEGTGGTTCDNCPSNICLGVNSTGCKACGECCTCVAIPTTQYSDIFENRVSLYDLSMMRAGIPDADTIGIPRFRGYAPGSPVSVDTLAQVMSRTHAIGNVEYLAELSGFDWVGGWTRYDNKYWWPTSPGLHKSSYPSARYTSSGFTLLGTVLWLLDDTRGEKKDWQTINLNQYLPPALGSLLNFGGTSGNGGTKYMVKAGATKL
jgi:hypothetical protein